jgi:hypothetical protein
VSCTEKDCDCANRHTLPSLTSLSFQLRSSHLAILPWWLWIGVNPQTEMVIPSRPLRGTIALLHIGWRFAQIMFVTPSISLAWLAQGRRLSPRRKLSRPAGRTDRLHAPLSSASLSNTSSLMACLAFELKAWPFSGASIQARRIRNCCWSAVNTRIVSPSMTPTHRPCRIGSWLTRPMPARGKVPAKAL